MTEPDTRIGPDDIAYTLELTPAQLKVTYYALRAYRDDFGHNEHEVSVAVNAVLAKFPEEPSIRGIKI
jgi:hypothetical protein